MIPSRLALLLLLPLLAAACDSEPTAVDSAALQPADPAPRNLGATVELVEVGPIPLSFPVFVACLGSDVVVSGTVSLRDRIVTRGDGSQHVTRKLDVSNTMISLGNQVWTAGKQASEIFITETAPDGSVVLAQHLGAVIFRSGDGQPELKLMHQIHFVDRSDGDPQLSRDFFEIRCIAPEKP